MKSDPEQSSDIVDALELHYSWSDTDGMQGQVYFWLKPRGRGRPRQKRGGE